MSSVERTIRDLQVGVGVVQTALAAGQRVGVAYKRVERIADASRQIAWVAAMGNYVPSGGPDVQVVVLEGQPFEPLDRDATFQANEDRDGRTRIYVQCRPYTALWAAIALFHELDHVLDHLDGTWPAKATSADWWNAEARAYHREALIIDVVVGGTLLPLLDKLARAGLPALLARNSDDIGHTLYWEAFPARLRSPAKGIYERGARNAALAMAAVVAAEAAPRSLTDMGESLAGREVRRAAEAWGFST